MDYFLDRIEISIFERTTLKYLYDMSKKLPASIAGYHGDYRGGLFDHVLLVTNFCYINFKMLKNTELTLDNVLKSAMYHDFEKIIRYAPKWNVKLNFKIYKNDKDDARYRIRDNFFLNGGDYHIDGCFALIKKLDISVNDEIKKGIIFHHGGWAKYRPNKSNKLSALLHAGDMIASQTLKT